MSTRSSRAKPPAAAITTTVVAAPAPPARTSRARKVTAAAAVASADENAAPQQRTQPAAQDESRAQAAPAAEDATVQTATATAVPATPARVSKKTTAASVIPSTPAVAPSAARAVPATPANAVPATPARRAAGSMLPLPPPPPPLPARPTSFVSTDEPLLGQIKLQVARVEQVYQAIPPRFGAPLDGPALFAQLSAAEDARVLAEVSEELGVYLFREAKYPQAEKMLHMAAQYTAHHHKKRAPHLVAEQQYGALRRCFHLAASVAHPHGDAAAAAFTAALTPAEALVESCAAQRSDPAVRALAVVQFSFARTMLTVLAEIGHAHLERCLILFAEQSQQLQASASSASTAGSSKALAAATDARKAWMHFVDLLTILLTEGVTEDVLPTLAQQEDLAPIASRVGDDMMWFASIAAMLELPVASPSSSPHEDGWTAECGKMLRMEARRLAQVCQDDHLERWRLARLLLSPCTTTSATTEAGAAAMMTERAQLVEKLARLRISGAPIQSHAKQPACAALGPFGVLQSLAELVLASSAFPKSLSDFETEVKLALRDTHARATSVPGAAHSCPQAVVYLTRAVLQAPNSLHGAHALSKRAMGSFLAAIEGGDRNSPSVEGAASQTTPAAAGGMSRTALWLLMSNFVRAAGLRAVLAEHMGLNASAHSVLSCVENTVSTALFGVQSTKSTGSGEKVYAVSLTQPYAPLLACRLHHARVQAKMDCWAPVLDTLSWAGVPPCDPTTSPPSSLPSNSSGEWERRCADGAVPFLGSFAMHPSQLAQLRLQAAASASSASSEDSLSYDMKRLSLTSSAPSSSASSASSCSQCTLFPSACISLSPCVLDRSLARLRDASVPLCAKELEAELAAHASLRHPPLWRALHHRLAALREEQGDQIAAVMHAHSALGTTARHQLLETHGEPGVVKSTATAETPAASVVAPVHTLNAWSTETDAFQQFQHRIPTSWSDASVDVDWDGKLLLSKTQWQVPVAAATASSSASAAASSQLTATGLQLRVLLESCLLATVPAASVTASLAFIRKAHNSDAADNGDDAPVSAVWRLDASISPILSLFAAALQSGVDGDALAAAFNKRPKSTTVRNALHSLHSSTSASPELKAKAADFLKKSEEGREVAAMHQELQAKRAAAEQGVGTTCTQLQTMLGAQVACLSGRWADAAVEAAVCASALRLQSLVGTVALTADAVAAEVARLRKDHFSSSAADLPTRLPVVLIVGPALVHLPLESLPALRSGGGAEGGGGQVLTRMSSWTFMAAALEAHAAAAAAAPVPPQLAGPTDEQGYYVLNPQQNLPRAEQLLPLLEERGWAGSKGAPRVDEWKDALRRPSYFVYVGHNGGEEFVTPRTIRASPTGVSAVALQMGCCSALQRVAKGGARALYEPEGLSLAYQIARCPAMIGCLWTVSDDVDRWTARMLTEVHEQRQRNATATAAIAASQTATAAAAPARGRKTKAAAAAATTPAAAAPTPATPPSVSLQQLALASLPACNKPFLTGAAIVCYGLPVGV